jgi:nucleotide-binding universal stress UspA family protein
MKRLLIPTDFSEISKNSIKYGFQVAVKLNLNVQLVHVLELYKFAAGTSEAELISTILPAENIIEMESLAMESFKKMLDELKDSLPAEVNYDIKVVSGHLVNEMIVESALDETEIMILAVAGNQDLVTRFTHSTISSIISDAVCPVIVVPSGYSFKTIDKVVFATDFNKADLDIFERFLNLFQQFKPIIEVIHVSPKVIDFKTELKFAGFKQLISERIIYPNVSFKLINHKNVVQGTIETLKSDNADMLLMLKEHGNFFKSLFETSKTDKIAHFLKVPMISYHEIDQVKKK